MSVEVVDIAVAIFWEALIGGAVVGGVFLMSLAFLDGLLELLGRFRS